MIKKIVETASLITTVSEQSKQDIHALFSVPDARVVNTYQDVDLDAAMLKQSQDEVAEALSGVLGLEFGKYFLFYGAIEPKKNVGRLIEAHLGSSLDLPLVLVGKDGWLVDGELQLYSQHLQRRIGPQRVIRLPYVSREQLINLIRGACAVTFPSLYEGFGLPLVEAMVCGTPVLTSNIGAMKEVAGEAALFVDPYDVSSIRDGLRRMAYNRPLQDELRLAGGERALHFSSERYRKRLLAAYASATC
ncbi:glycosyltransferase family 4 protein (plasmid) [Ensifer adhaerens]